MVMGVSPLLVIFGGIYHWYPLITGRRLDDRLGHWHFWITFLGTYAIFFPMHYLGVLGMPRRYYEFQNYSFIPDSAHVMNAYISVAAFIVALGQLLFLFNLAWSVRYGKPAGHNPWRAASLEWQTPDVPPVHGNWGPALPVVYRWPYEYSVPGDVDDVVPQNMAPDPRRPATLVHGDTTAVHRRDAPSSSGAPPAPDSPDSPRSPDAPRGATS
jgi:cytochrome c oxidase subunit 1